MDRIGHTREASRHLVREWGLLSSRLANTAYDPSAVHGLLELEFHQVLSSSRLASLLGLEKSTISRMVNKLHRKGEIVLDRSSDPRDGRRKLWTLTEKGKKTVETIHQHADAQVEQAFAVLSPRDQEAVLRGLVLYGRALSSVREGRGLACEHPAITEGMSPGLFAAIVQLHGEFYMRFAGFGIFFEHQVAEQLLAFVPKISTHGNAIWSAKSGDQIVGSIAIEASAEHSDSCHLRWFIVDDAIRGAGVGKRLLRLALEYADSRGFDQVRLWTFAGLDTARALYESHGFKLAREQIGARWGKEVTEQEFLRVRQT